MARKHRMTFKDKMEKFGKDIVERRFFVSYG